jgi:membrane protease YdiL (CAAX protease family)
MKRKQTNPIRTFLASIFMTRDEPRLRLLWRLLLHAGLVMALMLITSSFLFAAFGALGSIGLSSAAAASLLQNLTPPIAFLLATWIARRVLDRRTFRSLGFNLNRHTLLDLSFGFVLPGLLFGVIFGFESAMGWIQFEGWAWEANSTGHVAYALFATLGSFITMGISEEILSRGYHLQNMAEAMNPRWAVFLSSAIFAFLHLANPYANASSFVGILAAGYFLAFAWQRTRNLWLPNGLHVGWNFFEGAIFGYPVSGLTGFSLMRLTVSGPEIITGGAFGPEAGLVVYPAILLGAVLIWIYTRNRTFRHISLVDPPS